MPSLNHAARGSVRHESSCLSRCRGLLATAAVLMLLSACGGGGDDSNESSVPAFSEQPANVVVAAGQSAALHARAEADGELTYQWYRDGEAIEGATDPTLLLDEVDEIDHGARFSVEAETEAGSVSSQVAVLSVDGKPVAPVVDLAPEMQEDGTTLSITASGTGPFTYQWQRDGVDVPGATEREFRAGIADDASYGVTVSNEAGSSVSREIVLEAASAAAGPTIRAQPKSVAVTQGQTATFRVVARGTGTLKYEWYAGGRTSRAGKAATFTIKTTLFSKATQVWVVVSDATGKITSAKVNLTVFPAVELKVKAHPLDAWTTVGKRATFAASLTGSAPVTYRWYKNSKLIEGATAATYTTPLLKATDDASSYHFVAKNVKGQVVSSPGRVRITGLKTAYPTKPIVLTIPFVAGSTNDLIGRAFAQRLGLALGQPVNVQNVPGSWGAIGTSRVATSAADGHTLLLTDNWFITLPALQSWLYRPQGDLAPLGVVAEQPLVLMAALDMPNSIAKLRSYVQANAGGVAMATAGTGTVSDLCASLVQAEVGPGIVKVPYKGNAAASNDVSSGIADLYCAPRSADPIVARLYGVTTLTRSTVPSLAALRTLDSVGFDGFQVTQWFGLYAAPATPTPIVLKINEAMRKVQTDGTFLRALHANNAQPVTTLQNTPKGHGAFVGSEVAKWAPFLEGMK